MKKNLLLSSIIASTLTFTSYAAVGFNDTFEPDGATAATRHDDVGAGFGTDIQWRPRVAGQAANFSMVNDAVMGNALAYTGGQNLFIIGQFDDDASDGVTLGASAAPFLLGSGIGDRLRFSFDIRTTAALVAGFQFKAGLGWDPDGTSTEDPAVNTWANNVNSYYLAFNSGPTVARVSINQEAGNGTTAPLQGADVSTLTSGIDGMVASVGGDTLAHSVALEITRGDGSVQLDAYWDRAHMATAVDSSDPFTLFNTFTVSYGPGGTYVFDNVKLEVVPEPGTGMLGLVGLGFLFLRRKS
jgi:hypothetical protein